MPQRCTDERPHGPHKVRARYRKHSCSWVFTPGFTCAGHDPAEFERQLTEAFGPE
jgi:hypothetical protein